LIRPQQPAAIKETAMDSSAWNPEWLYGVFIVALGLALAYGVMRNRSRTRAEKNLTEQATEARYRQEDQKQQGKPLPE
jgi:hypothetical protein